MKPFPFWWLRPWKIDLGSNVLLHSFEPMCKKNNLTLQGFDPVNPSRFKVEFILAK